jgi:hypothetical protein
MSRERRRKRAAAKHAEEQVWVHPLIAIDLGMWLKPEFTAWVSEQILALLRWGKVSVPREHQEAMLARLFGPDVAAQFTRMREGGPRGRS